VNINNIFVFDNLIPDYKFDRSVLDNFKWEPMTTADYVQGPNIAEPNSWLSRRVYGPEMGGWVERTPDICIEAHLAAVKSFRKINDKCRILFFASSLLHNFLPRDKLDSNDIHQDNIMPHYWTAVLHVSGDGPTTFYEDQDESTLVKTVDFVPGRITIFPSVYWHRSNIPQGDHRHTIGMTFVVRDLVDIEYR
jgi:hypothetical protein